MGIRLCFVGHITRDRIWRDEIAESVQPGGTAWYGSHAASGLGVDVHVVTRLQQADSDEVVRRLERAGISADVYPAAHSTTFVNHYRIEEPDGRTQLIESLADPFEAAQLQCQADAFVFGPLNPADFTADLLAQASCNAMVALDIQGLLRSPGIGAVRRYRHPDLSHFLGSSRIVKASRDEAQFAANTDDVEEAIEFFLSKGVSEVLVTLGSEGSIVATDSEWIEVPPYSFKDILDTTGCGDVYLAVYVVKRLDGHSALESAYSASAAAGLSATVLGPPRISAGDIEAVIRQRAG